jgi:hypothetical protein
MIYRARGRHSARLALATVAFSVAAASLALAQGGASAAPRAATQPTGNTFPPAVWNVGVGHVGFSSPTIAQIDGVRAVVVATESGWVYVLNASTGRELPGWPQPVTIAPGQATAVDSTPTVAYLDGPNRPPSIIVGAGSLYVKNQQGGLEAFYANGQKRFVFHTRPTFDEWAGGGSANGYDDAVFSTPAVGDITGSGQQDIVFGSYDHYIYALTPSGSLVPGFPYNNQDTIWSSPALYDVTHSGRDDIYIGADSTGLHGCWGGWLYDLRYVSGAPRVEWSRCEHQTFWSSPTIGEIDHSGRAAVVLGTSWNTTYGTPATSDKIYAFYADNGTMVPGWPATTNGPTFGSPAIGNVLGNGQVQVVATSCAHCSNGPATVSVFTGGGKLVWSRALNAHEELGSPTLVDLTNSNANDIVVGNTLGLYLLNGRYGTFLYGTNGHPVGEPCAIMNQPAVTLVPGVGWRLFDACGGPISAGHVIAYPLPYAPRTAPAWPEFRGNTAHTGVAPDPVAPASIACKRQASPYGYRFVAADGGVFSYGNLGFCGSTGGQVLPARVAGMATTPDKAGYWLATADGSVYAFGDAHLYASGSIPWGSLQGLPLPGPIVGIVATTDGRGYYLVGADGSVYSFGDAANLGSLAGQRLNHPIVGMALDTFSHGYWLVASDGGIFAFHARFYGSTGNIRLHSPIVGMAEDPRSGGYWFVAADGGIFAYHAHYYGSMGGHRLSKPIVGMTTDPTTGGYWLVGDDGGIFSFHANYYGSTGNIRLNQPIDGMSA